MGTFGLAEPQGLGDRVEHLFGDAAGIAPFELGVVVDADSGQHGDLFAAQPRDTPVAAVGDQPGLVRGDPGPPGGQELADLAPAVHITRLRFRPAG